MDVYTNGQDRTEYHYSNVYIYTFEIISNEMVRLSVLGTNSYTYTSVYTNDSLKTLSNNTHFMSESVQALYFILRKIQ
ncbi:MAG: hypothetical protein ACK4TN_07635 [Brevinematales bacterium]